MLNVKDINIFLIIILIFTIDKDEKKETKTNKKVSDNENTTSEVNSGSNFDLLDLNSSPTNNNLSPTQQNKNNYSNNNLMTDSNNLFDILTTDSNANTNMLQGQYQSKNPVIVPKKLVLDENTPGANNGSTGIVIEASVQRDNNLYLILNILNKSNVMLTNFEIQLNTNYYGINCMSNSLSNLTLASGKSTEIKIDLFSNVSCDLKKLPNTEPYLLQAAIRCNLDEFFFKIPVIFCVLFENEKLSLSMENFISIWQGIQTRNDMSCSIENLNPKYQNTNAV